VDKLRAMTAFVAIVDRGSLTAAADALGTSLPSVVRTLAALEQDVGVRLINRTTRRLHLTDEGAQYLDHCRAVLAAIRDAEAALAARRVEPQGRLAITASVLFGRRHQVRESWLGISLIPVIFGGVVVVMLALRTAWPALHNVDANPFEALVRSPLDALTLGVLVVLTGGLKEELQRAFVLHRFDQHLGGARLGLVLYSFVFGTGHIIQGYDVAIVTALLGLAWGTIFIWRRSLVAPAVSHAGFNAAQILQFVVFGA